VFLASPGAPAELAEERGLLVAGDARDGDAAEAQRGGHFAHVLARPDDFRQQAGGNVEDAQQLGRPTRL
jgi:hypothetical protein